jgi:hemoglobin-like flavoprotein/uncharacterized protein YjbI with pentapeptide repeats
MSLNVDLLEQSFERIKPCADEFVASFYENLFAAHPEVRPLFANTEMEKQQKKLLNALVLVVENLRNPEVLGAVLNSLGARHIGYGAIPKYYPAVGQALLLTFEQYLQGDWTPEHKKAWTDAYGALTAQMLQAMGSIQTTEARSQPETNPALPSVPSATTQANTCTSDISPEAEVEEIPALALSELPVELLERSFEKIKPHAEEFAASFYENLFQAHPELKPMFAHVDMAQQQQKLLSALVLVVENLRNPSALGSVLSALGGRHIGYGSLPQQYPAVGKALLLTFEHYLQDDWTPELKKAWRDAYGTITAQMLQGAAKQAPPQVTPAQKTETSEPTAASEESTESQTESKTGFKQGFQEFQAKVSIQQWKTFPKRVLGRSSEAFWAAPVWLVAAIAAITWSGIFVVAEENSLIAKVLEGADTTSLILALVLFIKEAPDRRKQFHYQAWSTVDAAHGVKVSYARILALQDLNEDGVSLRGLDAPGAEFVEIQLPNANLSHANLSAADLSNAYLSHADLNKANLHQTKLSGANLSDANLSFAQLTQANLSSASLSSANLICADLSRANLSGANLRNANLSGANLAEAYLTGANLKGAKISMSELQAAFVEGATMPDGSKYRSEKSQ